MIDAQPIGHLLAANTLMFPCLEQHDSSNVHCQWSNPAVSGGKQILLMSKGLHVKLESARQSLLLQFESLSARVQSIRRPFDRRLFLPLRWSNLTPKADGMQTKVFAGTSSHQNRIKDFRPFPFDRLMTFSDSTLCLYF